MEVLLTTRGMDTEPGISNDTILGYSDHGQPL
jgi:hypothetical protein